jgi:PKD repeat protein
MDNTVNAYDSGINTWHSSDPAGGNYWDDYTGLDADDDGVGDTDYNIPGGENKDIYPLIDPITEPPDAEFAYSPPTPTTQDTIQFTDISTDPDGYITSWSWNFGDYSTSTLQNPSHTYTDDGVYNVSLTVTDNYGVSTEITQFISVLNVAPTANFEYFPDIPTDLETIIFNDTSSDLDGTIISWIWDFGDGNTSEEQNPTHQYADNGTYTITLNVSDDDGAIQKISQQILVLNVKPTASFGYTPSEPTINDTIQLTDFSQDYDGSIVSWSWDFDDGESSTEASPSHKYESQGTYMVTLTVTDNDGESDDIEKAIIVKRVTTGDEIGIESLLVYIIYIILFIIMIAVVFYIKRKFE